jgi:membrane-associated phospholipid phosphatase
VRLAVCLLLALLSVLTWQVVRGGPLLGVDRRARSAVARLAADGPGARVGPFARFVADLGDAAVAGSVLAVVALYAAWWHRRRGAARWWLPVAAAAVAGGVVPAVVVPFKVLVGRAGPGGPLVAGQLGFFPSGHAATAAVCYGAAALLAPRHRRACAVVAAVVVFAVGPALVWCGYHWVLDVVAAWCLSGTVLLALCAGPAASAPGSAGAEPGAGRRAGVSRWWGSRG